MPQLEKFFEELFLKKVPYQIPPKVKEVIVKVAPWVTLIILILSLPAVLAIFGMGSMIAGMGAFYGVRFGFMYYLALAVLVVELVFMAMAIPGLMNREIKGWRYIFYADLISAVYAILSSYGIGSLIWSLIGVALGLYLIFQVKSCYK